MQDRTRRAVADPLPNVRGWCPTVWRPMMAGDGLLVRVRPPMGRLSRVQALALCDAALRHGNGHIDITNRAGLQVRGVREADWQPLIGTLVALRLADPDPEREARPPIILNPDWRHGDDTETIARVLASRIDLLPPLPAKIGFAIDAGSAPALSDCPADFRIERGVSGGLILRADGREQGVPVRAEEAADAMVALARWFIASGGVQAGRMARHAAPLPTKPAESPAAPRPRTATLATAPGAFRAAPFGRIEADALRDMLGKEVEAVRLTPWRGLILDGSEAAPDDPDDPRLRVHACPGAPACPQASVATRNLAARLAPHVPHLHVSGCAKGCAHPEQAATVLTGREGGFDLARDARAGAPPIRAGLNPRQIIAFFGAS